MKKLALEIVGGLLVRLLALEALSWLLPTSTATSTGYYIDPEILSYPAGHRWTMSTGWDMRNAQRLVANNLGFASDTDFVANPNAVVLVGDSYVEASMLPAASRPGAQLQRLLPGRPVYAMGAPGTALLDYAERIRYAATQLQARHFVVLMEPGDVEQALCGSGNVHSQCLAPDTLLRERQRQGEAAVLKQWLRHSALAQYLVSQLKVQPAELLATAFRREVPHGSAENADDTPPRPDPHTAAPVVNTYAKQRQIANRVADEFLATVKQHADPARVLIVVDGQRPPTVQRSPATLAAAGRFVQRARESGLPVLELDDVFAPHRAASSRSLSVSPMDGHLNELGVALAARAVAHQLQREKQ